MPTRICRSRIWPRAAGAWSRWRLVFEMPIWFLKYYVLRRLFIYGSFGFSMAVNAAFGRYLRVAKAVEAENAQRKEPLK